MTDFYLTYHGSNSANAEAISNRLENSNYKITHIPIMGDAGPYLSERLIPLKKPIILLISDNFLKSTICMYDALSALKNLLGDDLIYPILVPGNYGKGGDNYKVDTQISKVSHVVSYMSYWKDIYTNARKDKPSFLNSDKKQYNQRLQELKAIQTEAGEYIRHLRDIEHIRYEDIVSSDFELLYKFLKKHSTTEPIQKDDRPRSSATTPSVIAATIPAVAAIDEKSKINQIIEHKAIASAEHQTSESRLTEADGFIEVKNIELDLSNGFSDENLSDKPLTDMVIPLEANDGPALDLSKKKVTIKNADNGEFDHTQEIINDSVNIFEAGQYEAGFIFLEDYLKYSPANVPVRMHLANMRYDFGDQDKAADDMLYILKLDDSNVQAHKWLAEHYDISKKPSKALHHLLMVQALQPDSSEVDYKLGLLLKNHIKDLNSAKSYFESALKKNPKDSKSLFQLGLIKKEQGDTEAAKTLLEKTLDSKGNMEESNYEIAKIFLKANDLDKVKEHWALALTADPSLKDSKIETFLAKKKKKQKQKDRLESIRKSVAEATPAEPLSKVKKTKKKKSKDKKSKKKSSKAKTILITGATSGIGKATAQELANRGHRLILTGRRSDKLEAIAKEIKKVKVRTLCFDVRDFEAAKAALATLTGKWATIDILINNAGLAQGTDPIHEANVEDWNTMIDTNVKGILHMTRLVAKSMADREEGHIVNVCSTAGHEVYPGGSVYCASKFAVRALTKGMRLDLHKYNIRVSQVSPGAVEETEFARVRFKGDTVKAKIYEDYTPVNSGDVAKVIRFMITRPKRVNIEDVLVMGTQQASAAHIDRSGRING